MINSLLLRYGVAVLAVAQVLLIKLLLAPQIGKETPFLLLFTAVMVSAGYGGMGPGLLAIALVTVASNYFFLPPVYSFSLSLDEILKMGVFGLEGLLVTAVITALNTAKEKAEAKQEQLAVERKRLEEILQQMPAGVIIAEASTGKFMFGNARCEQILGKPYLPSKAVAEYREWQPFHIDGQPYVPDRVPMARALFKGEFVTAEEMKFPREEDGTWRFTSVNAAPIRDMQGNITAAVTTLEDITERKRLEDILRQRAEKLEQLNRIKDEFLATLSHELRTPLNAVLGWSQLLRTRKLNEDRVACGLETIERNAKSQVQLIEDLLDVSSLIKGRLHLDVRSVDLVPVIEAAIATVRPAANAKTINFRFAILDSGLSSETQNQSSKMYEEAEIVEPNHLSQNPNSKPLVSKHQYGAIRPFQTQNPKFYVLGDADRLQQIVWNLLSNAVKFTPQGGRVEVRLERVEQQSKGSKEKRKALHSPTSYAQIQVSDTGKGIHPDFLPYLFDRFLQADSTSTRMHNGLGLGLAIARHLVELHGGTIHVDSQGEGHGATFTVKLPCLTAGDSEVEASQGYR